MGRGKYGWLLKQDGKHCQFCGSTRNLTIDHIIPRSLGGRRNRENVIVLCKSCNERKGNRLVEIVWWDDYYPSNKQVQQANGAQNDAHCDRVTYLSVPDRAQR